MGNVRSEARKSRNEDRIEAELTDLVYRALPTALWVGLVVATIVAALAAPTVPAWRVFAWLGLIAVPTTARLMLARAYLHADPRRPGDRSRWRRRFSYGVASAAVGWGSGAYLLWSSGDPAHQAFLAISMAGISSGAVTTLAPLWSDARLFLLVSLAPLAARFAIEGGANGLAMAGLTIVFLLTLLNSARRIAHRLRENVALKLESAPRDEFLSIVSHELRTPMTAIRGALTLLSGGVAGELPERAGDLVSMAERNSDRLVRLIDDLFDLEQIRGGDLALDLDRHELGPIVADAVGASASMARDHDVRIRLAEPIPDVEVRIDRLRTEQVVTNLLVNAAKFSPAGRTVEVTVREVGDRVRVSIHDDGPGVADDARNHIFAAFTQGDASDRREKGGAGIGLAISRSLVEAMEGEMDFRNERHRGATFFFELPVLERSA